MVPARAGSFGGTLLNFLITVVISAILYTRGESAAAQVRQFFQRLAGDRGDVIVTLSGQAIRAVALGIVVTAIAQTALAGLGLLVAGVPFAGSSARSPSYSASLGARTAPGHGAVGDLALRDELTGRGTVLLIFMVLAQTIDQVLRPMLIRRSAGGGLSLLLILPGVVGGLLAFGIIGLFVGPVILAVASTLLSGWITFGLDEAAPQRPTEYRVRAGRERRGNTPVGAASLSVSGTISRFATNQNRTPSVIGRTDRPRSAYRPRAS